MIDFKSTPTLWWSLPPPVRTLLAVPLSASDPSGQRSLVVALRASPFRLLELRESGAVVECRLWESRRGQFRESAGAVVPRPVVGAVLSEWLNEKEAAL